MKSSHALQEETEEEERNMTTLQLCHEPLSENKTTEEEITSEQTGLRAERSRSCDATVSFNVSSVK